MRTEKFLALAKRSWEHMVFVLFRTFSVRKWGTLLLIASLAGALGSSNFRMSNPRPAEDRKISGEQTSTAKKNVTSMGAPAVKPAAAAQTPQTVPNRFWIILIMSVIGGLAVAFLVFFMWLSNRFQFVWLNAVLRNISEIKEPFHRYRLLGNSLFKVDLVALGIFLSVTAAAVVWGFFKLQTAGVLEPGALQSPARIFNAAGIASLPLLLVVLSLVVFSLFGALVNEFTVPLMAAENETFMPAWGRFWAIFIRNVGDFFKAFCFNFLLILVATVANFILLLGGLLILALAAGILFGPLYWLLVVLAKIKILFIILAVLLGIPFGVVAFLLIWSVSLPSAVFFRSFTVFYLASLQEGYLLPSLGNNR